MTRSHRADLRLQDVYLLFWFIACPVKVMTSGKATAPIKRFVLDLGAKSLQMSVGEIENIGDGMYSPYESSLGCFARLTCIVLLRTCGGSGLGTAGGVGGAAGTDRRGLMIDG